MPERDCGSVVQLQELGSLFWLLCRPASSRLRVLLLLSAFSHQNQHDQEEGCYSISFHAIKDPPPPRNYGPREFMIGQEKGVCAYREDHSVNHRCH